MAEERVEKSHVLDYYQARDKYDAEVTLYGCPIFRNGQYCYIDPTIMGISELDMIKLGGQDDFLSFYPEYEDTFRTIEIALSDFMNICSIFVLTARSCM